MRYAIIQGFPETIRGKLWKIICKVDSIKVKMIKEHEQFEDSEQVYKYYRDKHHEKTSEDI